MMNGLAGDIGPIGKSGSMDETFHRAHRLALVQGHGQVTLEHMLFALTEDPDAISVLSASGIVIDKLRTDVSAYLGRLNETLPPAGATGAQPGPDLLRIVQLAASAARQSPRKQIDGAIILAAIIGEAKSPAAGMLKAHGLTFDEVIKVLQRAQTAVPPARQAPAQPPRPAPQPAPQLPSQAAQRPSPPPAAPPPTAPAAAAPQPASALPEPHATPPTRATPSTEDILASVRARVKQAEPPPLTVRAPATISPPSPPAVQQSAAKTVSPAATEPPRQRPPQADSDRPAQTAVGGSASVGSPSKPASAEPASITQATPPTADGHPAALPETQPAAAETTAATPAVEATKEISAPEPQTHTRAQAASAEDQATRSPAFDALTKAPRAPRSAPPPQPPAKPTPPPIPSAATAPRSPSLQPSVPPQYAHQPVPLPPVQAGQPRPAPQAYTAATSPQAMAQLKPAVPLDIIAAARGIPGEIPVGESIVVEIRIPRDQLDVVRPQIQASPARVEAPIIRTVSVQLVSEIPGALAITPLSAETIWYDRPTMTAAEEGIWRFALTPVLKGKHGVTLSVHGRTIGPYGIQLDPSVISETFEVTVRRYLGARILRLGGYVAVFVLGALITNLAGARIAETVSTWVRLVMK